ncbi:N-acetylglucosamine kinase [Microbacterium murale]|uniref:Glucosamine kinase n=1 Tax=Microbacterium murale TaxID=1081040 RepID=A0ABU0PBU5_9MICO|nr:BadF/BadG/BcrA/BcrD ATPase family protein [Microbacterium murale]MDQ0644798.1 glucosamine kinase [Microbacterium murale]
MPIEPMTAAVDLGKTRCRVAMISADGRTVRTDAGTPGLVAADGIAAAVAAILPLLEKTERIDSIGVGAAGAWTAPDAAAALARTLADAIGAHVAVTSDVVSAHAGALQGAPGTLLIAGTGAAALGVDADGVRLVDGWGPDLGDLGSGSWIGREGVRAMLRARDGLGPPTALSEALRAHIAPALDPITWLVGDIPTARQLATAAPLVLDAAAVGDAVAANVVAEAVRLLTASAVAASDRALEVAVHGGLTDHSWFRAELERALTAAGRTIVPAVGDALDGAALLARRTDMPHERFVHRAE